MTQLAFEIRFEPMVIELLPLALFIHVKTLYAMDAVYHAEWFVYQDNIEYTSFDTQSDAETFAKELTEAYPDSTVKVEEIYVC